MSEPLLLPEDIWERAGFVKDALESNRSGMMTSAQRHMAYPRGWLRFGLALTIFPVAVLTLLWSTSRSLDWGLLVYAGILAIFFCVGAGMLFAYWKGRQVSADLNVSSACGQLTKCLQTDPEGLDNYGLKLGDESVFFLSQQAHTALPEGHYRIHYAPMSRRVVNVEEHAEGSHCLEAVFSEMGDTTTTDEGGGERVQRRDD